MCAQAWPLRLSNLKGGFSSEKTDSSSFSSHYFPETLYLGIRPCEIPLIDIGLSMGVIVKILFRKSYHWDLMVDSFPVMSRRHWMLQASWSSASYGVSALFFEVSLNKKCRGCIEDVTTGTRQPMLTYSLHCAWLWISVRVFIYWEKKTLWRVWGLQLSVDIRISI